MFQYGNNISNVYHFIFAIILVLAVSYFTLRNILGPKLAYIVVFLRIIVTSFYLLFFFNNEWSTNRDDDYKYFAGASRAKRLIGYCVDGQSNKCLFNTLRWTWQKYVSYWKSISLWLFGEFYWAPLFWSTLTTLFAAWILFKLMILIDLPVEFSRLTAAYYAIHPYTIAWSSFVILKEDIAITVYIINLYFIIKILKARITLKEIILFLVSLELISSIRFHSLYILIASIGLFLMLYSSHKEIKSKIIVKSKVFWSGLFITCSSIVGPKIYGLLLEHIKNVYSSPFNAIRYLVSPLPWKLSDNYTFLLPGSLLNLFMLVPVIFSIKILIKKYFYMRFLIINFLISLVLYSLVGLNIRHRYQFEFILIIGQSYAFLMFANQDFLKLYNKTIKRYNIIVQKISRLVKWVKI